MPANQKIVFYGVWPEMKPYLKAKLGNVRAIITSEKLSEKNIQKDTCILSVFVESEVTKKMLLSLPRLRMIATMSTGYDHIDCNEARRRKITVCNVPSYGEITVAEHTIALMLALARKLFLSVKRVKEGVYDFHGLRGTDINGKTLGVIGTGHIGTNVIKLAKAFGMKIIAFDAFPNKNLARELNYSYVPLNKLLGSSDFITFHAPLLKTTYHLLNKKNIKKIKKGAFIINTARGGLIDAEALAWALKTNHIAGAGLDVLEDENLIQDYEKMIVSRSTQSQIRTSLMNNIIIDHPNTIVTPHNAFNSVEALKRIIDVTVGNIISYLKSKPLNIVN